MSEIELAPLVRTPSARRGHYLYHIILVGSPPKRRIPSSGGPRSSLPSERQAHPHPHISGFAYSDEKISSSPTATGQPQRYEDSIVFCDDVWCSSVRAAAADGALCGHVQLYQSYKLVLTRSAYIYIVASLPTAPDSQLICAQVERRATVADGAARRCGRRRRRRRGRRHGPRFGRHVRAGRRGRRRGGRGRGRVSATNAS